MSAPATHAAFFEELGTRTFHDIVRLRLDAFVVEQHCPYRELDGRDVLPTTRHLWVEAGDEVVAYLRMYPETDGASWIGRVVTSPAHRGRGLGTRLVRRALEMADPPVRIAAQVRLAPWYASLGFARFGPDFIEDGIAHTPMRHLG